MVQALVARAQAFADETRIRILLFLLEGDATVSDIVTRLGLPQPRVSGRLALLREAGLVRAHQVDRHRFYSADKARVQAVLEALGAGSLASGHSAQAAREVRRDTALRNGRTCYDHLAGVAGVQLMDGLLGRGWIELENGDGHLRPSYRLTPGADARLGLLGVDLAPARTTRRRFAFGCLDWTERRTHLGGALGAAMLDVLRAAGLIRLRGGTRAVVLRRSLAEWLDRADPSAAL